MQCKPAIQIHKSGTTVVLLYYLHVHVYMAAECGCANATVDLQGFPPCSHGLAANISDAKLIIRHATISNISM